LAEIESVKIAWLEVSDLLLLPEIESLLIAHFQPPFNKEYEVRFKPSGLTAASLPCATSFRKFTPTGWRLRALMAEKRITNQQLADRLQEITGKPRHRQTITRWRNADTMPLLDGKDLDALQQILECSRDDLLGD
jgi:DNA-binding Xre family transcriptional regulator